jgi:hypothetical protein
LAQHNGSPVPVVSIQFRSDDFSITPWKTSLGPEGLNSDYLRAAGRCMTPSNAAGRPSRLNSTFFPDSHT